MLPTTQDVSRAFSILAAALLTGAVLAPAPALAQGAPCNGNPLYGTWRLNEAKSTILGEFIPGRMAVAGPYRQGGVTFIFLDGVRQETWPIEFDGNPHATAGADPRLMKWTRRDCNTFDAVTLRQVIFNDADGTVKEVLPNAREVSRDHVVVTPDGKSFIDTRASLAGQGGKDEVLVFDRL